MAYRPILTTLVFSLSWGCGASVPHKKAPVLSAVGEVPDCSNLTEELTTRHDGSFDTAFQCVATMSPLKILALVETAMNTNQIEAGIFFYWAGRVRFNIDQLIFSTDKQGVLPTIVALDTVEETWLPVVLDHPNAVDTALELLRRWRPRLDETYRPDWPDRIVHTLEDNDQIRVVTQSEVIKATNDISDFSELLNAPGYIDAYKTVLVYEALPEEERNNPENRAAYDAAREKAAYLEYQLEQRSGPFSP